MSCSFIRAGKLPCLHILTGSRHETYMETLNVEVDMQAQRLPHRWGDRLEILA